MTDEEIKVNSERHEKALLIVEFAKNFNFLPYNDEYRCPNAGYYGGFQLLDNAVCSKLRSAGKELVKKLGSNIWSGNFNLTKMSFPIKCMAPCSILEIMPESQAPSSIYLNYAASINNPLERLKLVMVNSIAYFYGSKIFEKPLNPILGETF